MAQNVLLRTFKLLCRKFFFIFVVFFLAVFEILDQPCRCFWSFESSFFTVLAIVIRRLLYVPDYVIGSFNSFISESESTTR